MKSDLLPKLIPVVCLIFVLLTGAWTSGYSGTNDQCFEAQIGQLDIKQINYSNPSKNAYLLDCSFASDVGEVDQTNAEVERKRRNKRRVAQFLLSKNIDIKYINKYGTTLLDSVILSEQPESWKLKIVKLLIKRGVDVSHRNSAGYTAIDYAKFANNKKIVEHLSKVKR
jgi:ankyrin repeat protein